MDHHDQNTPWNAHRQLHKASELSVSPSGGSLAPMTQAVEWEWSHCCPGTTSTWQSSIPFTCLRRQKRAGSWVCRGAKPLLTLHQSPCFGQLQSPNTAQNDKFKLLRLCRMVCIDLMACSASRTGQELWWNESNGSPRKGQGRREAYRPRAPDTKNLPFFLLLSPGLPLIPGLTSHHWPAWQVTALGVAHQKILLLKVRLMTDEVGALPGWAPLRFPGTVRGVGGVSLQVGVGQKIMGCTCEHPQSTGAQKALGFYLQGPQPKDCMNSNATSKVQNLRMCPSPPDPP